MMIHTYGYKKENITVMRDNNLTLGINPTKKTFKCFTKR